ncbi:MAG: hypothetical protein F6K03_09515 [Kamptonema sp. SIO4C4]|nr:hypothetical protein [Kamptonema sp. SIO4C4]
MTTLPEIEKAIQNLPEQDIRRLADWLQEYLEQRWERQIEADAASGKLDHLIAQAEADIANNQVKPLDEVLRNS